MLAKFNLQGSTRKPLVKAIEELTGRKGKYCMGGAMKYAFNFGDGLELYRDGTLKSDGDITDLLAELAERGFIATVEQDETEAYAEREMRHMKLESENVPDYSNRGQYGGDEIPAFEDLQMTEGEELGLGKERREDFHGENGMRADDCPENFTYQAELSNPDCPDRMEVFTAENDVDTIAVEIPKNGLTDAQVQNILKLVESKRTLLTKALGRPLTINDTGETLQFIFPYSEEKGVGIIYSQLAAAFVNHVKKHSRVTATEREVESEKFALRTFLVRLGMNGAEYGAARKWLCRNLSGNASFPHDTSYAAMQASRRNGGQADEQE